MPLPVLPVLLGYLPPFWTPVCVLYPLPPAPCPLPSADSVFRSSQRALPTWPLGLGVGQGPGPHGVAVARGAGLVGAPLTLVPHQVLQLDLGPGVEPGPWVVPLQGQPAA